MLSDIKLGVDDPTGLSVTALHHLGLPDEQVIKLDWSELDRGFEPVHLTALYLPGLPTPVGRAFTSFGVLVDRLRTDCPWDAEQTHGSLRKHLIEETYEVLEAIDALELALALESRYGVAVQEDAEQNQQIFSSVTSLARFVEADRAA